MASRKGKRPTLPPFVGIPWDMLNSAAYRKLPPSAAKALPHFLGKPRINYGNSALFETPFPFSYSEANRYGFSSSTFFKVIRDLVAVGFIDPHTRGGLRGDGFSTSTFRFSRRWERYGQPEFEDVRYGSLPPEKNQKQLRKRKPAASFTEKNQVSDTDGFQDVAL